MQLRMKPYIIVLVPFLFLSNSVAQEQKSKRSSRPVKYTFRDPRSYFNHTIYSIPKKNLNFHIGHRFGPISGGYGTFFGMDDYANTQIALDYGITEKLTVGISRIRYHRIHDIYVKYLIARQLKQGFPLSLSAMAYLGLDGYEYSSPASEVIETRDRINYLLQFMVARKFGRIFSLQVAPQYIHRNLVESRNESNDAISLNSIFRVHSWGITSFQLEYHVEFSDYLENNQILSVGMNFETSKHNFAFFFSNASVMDLTAIMADSEIQPIAWENILFAFNISRRFSLERKKPPLNP